MLSGLRPRNLHHSRGTRLRGVPKVLMLEPEKAARNERGWKEKPTLAANAEQAERCLIVPSSFNNSGLR